MRYALTLALLLGFSAPLMAQTNAPATPPAATPAAPAKTAPAQTAAPAPQARVAEEPRISGIYIWLWIILANAAAIGFLSNVGGSTSAMGMRDRMPPPGPGRV